MQRFRQLRKEIVGNTLQNHGSTTIILLVTVVSFVICVSHFLKNDFWQDEIYTLDHFVFVPWNVILTDYHSTNNHVAFNVLVKALTHVMGVRSLLDAMEKPYIVRLVPFLFSMLSVVCYYLGTRKFFGKKSALTGTSVFCTSIVFIDFAVQVRGYSLSILLTILQFFVLLNVLQNNRQYFWGGVLFLLNTLNLLCLPTNIYISLSILLLCSILFTRPKTQLLFLNKKVKTHSLLVIVVVVALSMVVVLSYYQWLLFNQPENGLITTYKLFNAVNALQALAVFFHYTGYRLYLYVILILWLVCIVKRGTAYSKLLLPAFLFFAPFLFFFIHGAIIIQRTFLPLIPLFAMVVATAVDESRFFYKDERLLILCLINVVFLGYTFDAFLTSSKQNNRLSQHSHDLRNHYYLVNFNAREASLLARNITMKLHTPLLVWDDFGGTGVAYYLKSYGVPFIQYSNQFQISNATLLLSNNKAAAEKVLLNRSIKFKKLLSIENQYNLYLLDTGY